MSHVSTCPWLFSSHPPSFGIRLNTCRFQKKIPRTRTANRWRWMWHFTLLLLHLSQDNVRATGESLGRKTAWYHPTSFVMTYKTNTLLQTLLLRREAHVTMVSNSCIVESRGRQPPQFLMASCMNIMWLKCVVNCSAFTPSYLLDRFLAAVISSAPQGKSWRVCDNEVTLTMLTMLAC